MFISCSQLPAQSPNAASQPEPLCSFKYITKNKQQGATLVVCAKIASKCQYHGPVVSDLPRVEPLHKLRLRLLRLQPDGELGLTVAQDAASGTKFNLPSFCILAQSGTKFSLPSFCIQPDHHELIGHPNFLDHLTSHRFIFNQITMN